MNSDILISITMIFVNMSLLCLVCLLVSKFWHDSSMNKASRIGPVACMACGFMAVVAETMLWVDMLVSNL